MKLTPDIDILPRLLLCTRCVSSCHKKPVIPDRGVQSHMANGASVISKLREYLRQRI